MSKTILRPYTDRIERRRLRAPENPVWPTLEDLWSELLAGARVSTSIYRYERSALQLLASLTNVEPRVAVEVVLGMVLLSQEQPQMFMSDRAFRVQLTRRLTALSGSWSQHQINRAGKQIKTYREPPPKAAEIAGAKVMAVLGVAGLRLAAAEEREAEAKTQRKAVIEAAF